MRRTRTLGFTSTLLVGLFVGVGGMSSGDDRKTSTDGGAGKKFLKWDKNADGKVTSDEIPDGKKAFFSRALRRADKDGDGALSSEEFREIQAQGRRARTKGRRGRREANGRAALFNLLDTDKDGKLNGEELAQASNLIAVHDADGDGALSAPELAKAGRGAMTDAMMDERKKRRRTQRKKRPPADDAQ